MILSMTRRFANFERNTGQINDSGMSGITNGKLTGFFLKYLSGYQCLLEKEDFHELMWFYL